MTALSGACGRLAQDECDCVCNHSGACTGCGICAVEAWKQIYCVRPLPAGPGTDGTRGTA